MSPTELTAVGGFVLSLIALVVLPLWFNRQSAKQRKAQEEKEAIREEAKLDAAKAASDTVSWEGINRALRATAQETNVAHQERIVRLREDFAAETERLKRQTDYELDRANQKIQEMAGQIKALERRLAEPGGQ